MDQSYDDSEELPPELIAKLQLWEAVCRNVGIVKDAEYDQMLQLIESAKKTGDTDKLAAWINLAMENLTELVGIKLPMQPVGELSEDALLNLHVYAAEMQTSQIYRDHLDSELARLNMLSIQQGHGPLPGCEMMSNQEYLCSIDADAPAYTYSPSAHTSDAMWAESRSVLRNSQNKPLFDAAKEALVQEVLKGNIAVPGTQDPAICRAYAALNESGILPQLEQANIRFEEPVKQGAVLNANGSTMEGRGHMLHMKEDELRLVFTGNSEMKFDQWSALVIAYNMKNPQQDAMEFTREKDGSYTMQGESATLRAFAEHMHRGLTAMPQTPEMSVPQSAVAELENSRGR